MQEEYDFSQAKKATEIPHLNRLRQQSLLDEDVQNWLVKQDQTTKGYISEMIRQIMALQKNLVH